MGGCSGCGGKGHSSPRDTYGHILGCGSTKFPDQDRHNPFGKEDQRRILATALRQTGAKISNMNEQRFVERFAVSLQRTLETWCTDKYGKKHP